MAGYNMQWDNDYDVKEYRPKKKNRYGSDNLVSLPVVPSATRAERNLREDGSVMMTTAEILDFSEGSDSY